MTQDTQMIPVLQEHFPLINIFLKSFYMTKQAHSNTFIQIQAIVLDISGLKWLKSLIKTYNVLCFHAGKHFIRLELICFLFFY